MKQLVLFLLVILLVSCSTSIPVAENSLPTDPISGPFSDLGAWFLMDNPSDQIPGIPAPLILSDSNGFTFPQRLLTLRVLQNEVFQQFTFSFFPLTGRRQQLFTSDSLEIALESIYSSRNTYLLQCTVTNHSLINPKLTLQMNASIPDTTFSNILLYKLGNAELSIQFEKTAIPIHDNIYNLTFSPKQGQSQTQYIAITHRFMEEQPVIADFSQAPGAFEENRLRWIGYMEPYENCSAEEQILAAKCIRTLVTNWRGAAGELPYDGLFPSYAYSGFHGFWAWDSWKHAVALATFEPELAKNQIRTMFAFQNDRGMIADCIFRDTLIEKHNWRDTKPPLAAWAVYEVFDATHDTAFVYEMLPKLERYHSWWYSDRDNNRNGLCEYGSTDGTRIAAAWESGMDNAVRFDRARLVKINDGAWSLDQESVDLNAYLYAEKEYLARLEKIVGNISSAKTFATEAKTLKERIRTQFYSSKQQYFFDYYIAQQTPVEVFGPEAWITLWAGIATPSQAAFVRDAIIDTMHFNTFVPFPTLSYSHPGFNPRNGYWRGPVWIDQAWFALEGLKRYGFTQEYDTLKYKLLHNAQGMLSSGMPLYENYHPVTGEGLNAKHFSWTAAHLLLLLSDD